MTEEKERNDTDDKKCKGNSNGSPGMVYGLGVIGAAIYFIQHSHTFWIGVLGILKALVWPAFLIFKLFEYFKM